MTTFLLYFFSPNSQLSPSETIEAIQFMSTHVRPDHKTYRDSPSRSHSNDIRVDISQSQSAFPKLQQHFSLRTKLSSEVCHGRAGLFARRSCSHFPVGEHTP